MSQQCIRIGSGQYKSFLKHELRCNLQAWEKQGVHLRLTENAAGGCVFLDYCIADRIEREAAICRQIAQKIADLIINNWEDNFIADLIRINYYYFNRGEKSIIFDYAQKKLKHSWHNQEKKELLIKHKLTQCLGDCPELFIEGFIRFRLKNYVQLLYEVTEQAVDDFLTERECREFIELLQYFVAIQEPQADLVHVFNKPDGSFQLYDEAYKSMNIDHLCGIMLDLTDHKIKKEDLLISALITIAPRGITIHGRDVATDSYFYNIVGGVFGGRISKCNGCQLCGQQPYC